MLSRGRETRKVFGETLLLAGEEGKGSLAAGSKFSWVVGSSRKECGFAFYCACNHRGGGGGGEKEEGAYRAKVGRSASLAAEVCIFWDGLTLVGEFSPS